MGIYDYRVRCMDGTLTSLEDYRGKVVLIVNTASKCGFTPQFSELEKIYEKYKSRDFVVLGFPCNQFKEQDPEDNEKIDTFCRRNYGVMFPLFAKVEVNGDNADPLFHHLVSHSKFSGFDPAHPLGPKLDEICSADDANYASTDSIKWNFTKFLIDRTGEVVCRFEPTFPMPDVEQEIEKRL